MLLITEIFFDITMGLVLATVILFAANEGFKNKQWKKPVAAIIITFAFTFCAAIVVHRQFETLMDGQEEKARGECQRP